MSIRGRVGEGGLTGLNGSGQFAFNINIDFHHFTAELHLSHLILSSSIWPASQRQVSGVSQGSLKDSTL